MNVECLKDFKDLVRKHEYAYFFCNKLSSSLGSVSFSFMLFQFVRILGGMGMGNI